MPHLISNPGSRQSHPLYKNNCSCKHHNMKNIDGASNTEKEKSPEKNGINSEDIRCNQECF